MDKSWLYIDRVKPEFAKGLTAFKEYARQFLTSEGTVRCPCAKCCNTTLQTLDEMYDHCYSWGWSRGYDTWFLHGESEQSSRKRARRPEIVVESGDEMGPVINDFMGGDPEEEILQPEDDDKYEELISALHEQVYPGCENSSLLKFLADLMHIKVLYKWPNESFDVLLKKLKEVLPKGSNLPDSFYKANSLMNKLGLGYEKIDACLYDCCIYYKENANLQSCQVCKTTRYKESKGMKVPHKVLRYFPLKNCLRRLFASRHTAQSMTWHKTGRSTDEDVMRHPVDGKEWKEFDEQHPDFAAEPRNVRLSLATDGFCPFGTSSQTYSMWPVLTQVLNPAPWVVNNELYKYMCLLIPGPESPGKDLDVYLRPLIDELEELWSKGVVVRDASTNTTFRLRVAVMFTVNDFPARSYFSGWSGQGYKACLTCNDDTPSVGLDSKIGYVGHRRWLREDHPMRRNKGFNGEIETLSRPLEKTTEEVMHQISNLPECLSGKHKEYGGKNIKRPESCLNWRKDTILNRLPYWGSKKLKYNLDVMHIDKKVCDSILNTVLDVDGKTKDTIKARKDLEKMNVRHELHLTRLANNKFLKPRALFTLSQSDRTKFYQFLLHVKFPDGFAGNLRKNFCGKDKLTGLNSHDCHIILQRLLPVGLRKFLKKEISDTITDLSDFFRLICACTLRVSELEKAKEKILEILCTLETIFPPAFFDILIHVIMHLPEEAIRGGPVHLRWMYPIERYLGKLKKYIRNRAKPEGSIAEGYRSNQTLTFISLYFSGLETKFNRPERNWVENEDAIKNNISVFKTPFRSMGAKTILSLDAVEREKIEWYVLQNCAEIDKYLIEHRAYLARTCTLQMLEKQHRATFRKWFYSKMVSQHRHDRSHLKAQLLALSTGSFSSVQIVQSCVMKGVRFNTEKRDSSRITQNSGIAVKGPEDTMWYGVFKDIYVVGYPRENNVVLFKCTWFDTSPNKRGVRVYKNRTSINTKNTFYEDEPFILASQAEKVFYIDDLYNGSGWKVVEHFQHRHIVEAPTIDTNVVDDLVIDETTHANFQLFVQLPRADEALYMSANEIESHEHDDNYDDDVDNDIDADKYASSDDEDDDNDIDDDVTYDPNAPNDGE